ncbi:hypothetical protein M8C21_005097 [Ambrosia artemisiifolia]|uniref:Uncharacterized protein n=1 Tax=Ambrosia artemisiifolia TaxID=4212 RepID=A0AAD5GRA8_AMBAR|nr:hypothetical protein M8C21_005097 [Ambrosia artemisiifolia]
MNQHPGDTLDYAKYHQHHASSNNFDSNFVDTHVSLASITNHDTIDISSYWTIFGCHNGKYLTSSMQSKGGLLILVTLLGHLMFSIPTPLKKTRLVVKQMLIALFCESELKVADDTDETMLDKVILHFFL